MSTANLFSGKHYCKLVVAIWIFAVGTIYAEPPAGEGTDFSGSNVFWGDETNGVRIALVIAPLSSSNNVPIHCIPVIKSSITRTNRLHTMNLYFPPPESCYQMTLRDESGNLVAKTAKGKSLGKPITEPLMVKIGGLNSQAGFSMRPIIPNQSEMLTGFSFHVQDYFETTNAGKYRLTYEMRVILPQNAKGNYMTLHTTNLPTTILPAVVADVEIRRSAGK